MIWNIFKQKNELFVYLLMLQHKTEQAYKQYLANPTIQEGALLMNHLYEATYPQ